MIKPNIMVGLLIRNMIHDVKGEAANNTISPVSKVIGNVAWLQTAYRERR